jgi:hypothetical protein
MTHQYHEYAVKVFGMLVTVEHICPLTLRLVMLVLFI